MATIGVDLGGTKILAAVIHDGKAHHAAKAPTPTGGPESIVAAIAVAFVALRRPKAPLVFAAGPNITPPTTSGVTLEAFFPVSAPHRVRSSLLLAQSGGGGVVLPALSGQPQLFDVNGAPLSVSAGIGQPLSSGPAAR